MGKEILPGLNHNKSEVVATGLNKFLATLQVFSMNVHSYHWYIKGTKFFELHQKFDVLYTGLQPHIDTVAERVLTIGFEPLDTFSAYVKTSAIAEDPKVEDAKKSVKSIMDGFETLIQLAREVLKSADEVEDYGTNDLMTQLIPVFEMEIWM